MWRRRWHSTSPNGSFLFVWIHHGCQRLVGDESSANEATCLIRELIAMSAECNEISIEERSVFLPRNSQNGIKARAIGERLYELGGYTGMLYAHSRHIFHFAKFEPEKLELAVVDSKELLSLWQGIGPFM